MPNEFSLVVVKPLTVLEANIIDTNIAETDYPAYNVGTTYALAARIIYNHKIYESLQASNLGKTPGVDTTWWIEVSATNRYKAFDTVNSSQTANSTTIYYKLQMNTSVTSINLLNLKGCNTQRIKVTDATYGVIYDTETDLSPVQQTSDWWAWAFGTRKVTTVSVGFAIPSTPTATIEITLTGTSELAVGVILLGQEYSVGNGVKYGARVGIQDYSKKDTNQWGYVVFLKGAFAKRANFDMELDYSEVDSFYNFLAENTTNPCLWIGSKLYECTIIYGIYKEFEILIPYPLHADCSLELLGLT